MGVIESITVKVAVLGVLVFPELSLTGLTMATSMTCSLEKSLTGSMVMAVLASFIVAAKAISLPLALSLSVMNPDSETMEFVRTVPVPLFWTTASLNVSVIFELTATPVSKCAGLQVWVGPSISAAVKVAEATLAKAVPHSFSTPVDIAT